MYDFENYKTCFISYPYGKRQFENIIHRIVIPVLKELDIEPVIPSEIFHEDELIFDTLIRKIRTSDYFLCDLSETNVNVLYELGLAHAWDKPTVIIGKRLDYLPLDISSKYPYLLYSQSAKSTELFRERLFSVFNRFITTPPSLSSPMLERLINEKETIVIELFNPHLHPIKSISFIQNTLRLFENTADIELVSMKEIRSGSLGAWISSNIESLTSLAEKIIFFIPEWRLKNANRVKVQAETEQILSNAELNNAKATEIRHETTRKDAITFLEILDKAIEIGEVNITISDKLKIKTDSNGNIQIGPLKNDKNSNQ